MSHSQRIPKSEKAKHARYEIGQLMLAHGAGNLVFKWSRGAGSAVRYEPFFDLLHVSETFVEAAPLPDVLATALRVIEHAKKWPRQDYEEEAPNVEPSAAVETPELVSAESEQERGYAAADSRPHTHSGF